MVFQTIMHETTNLLFFHLFQTDGVNNDNRAGQKKNPNAQKKGKKKKPSAKYKRYNKKQVQKSV